jgi:hypothetical protein
MNGIQDFRKEINKVKVKFNHNIKQELISNLDNTSQSSIDEGGNYKEIKILKVKSSSKKESKLLHITNMSY